MLATVRAFLLLVLAVQAGLAPPVQAARRWWDLGAALEVTPATSIVASGPQGGQFSPSSFGYTLSASSGSVNYAISGVPSWLTASATSGTASSSGKTVTFTANGNANSLAAGTYSAMITFTNSATGAAQTQTATLTVNAPPTLQVSPATSIVASGPQSGPFSPSSFSYTLSASSGNVNYAISGIPSWLTASSTSGTASSSGTTVAFTVNANANSLAASTYAATITFTNSGTGATQTQTATLTVNPTLQVTPAAGIVASGPHGGPFSPSSFSYTLSASNGSLNYTISGIPSWLTASKISGTASSSGTVVTFTMNASANSLAASTYAATITFTNSDTGAARTLSAMLSASGGTTYYLSPNGNDLNSGRTPTLAWLTPNHPVNCGDVIIRAAGSYNNSNFGTGNWGTVSNCPSSGGVYFAQLQCAGPYVSSCSISASSGNAMWIDKSNWAVVGAINSAPNGSCFIASPSTATTIHHIAFVNVIANGCADNGVNSFPYWAGAHYGVDQFAIAGAIVYNAAAGASECFSGVSVYDPINWDTSAGTHVFLAGVFSYGNIDPIGCAGGLNSDGEGVIFDNWSNSQNSSVPYTGQGVIEQSMFLGNGSSGIMIYQNTAADVYITSSTVYGNYQDPAHRGTYNGELLYSGSTGVTSAFGNIFQATVRTLNSNAANYGAYVGEGGSNDNVSGNYIFGVNGNNDSIDASPGFAFGSNTLATPSFVNPTIPEAQTCPSSATTTACMAPTIANFKPQASGATGLGYQPPGACAPDPYFPVWLAGIVPNGIITKPCGY
jgi:hypothetical protein